MKRLRTGRRAREGSGGKKKQRAAPPSPAGAHPLPAPLPRHCASGAQAAARRRHPPRSGLFPPRGLLPWRPPHKAPEPAPRPAAPTDETERARADLQGCCGRAGSAGGHRPLGTGGDALGRPSSASGGGDVFFLLLPPSPPPHLLLLLPLLLRTTEVPRVRHRDSQQHGCHRRLPSPPSPAHRPRAKHGGRKGRGGASAHPDASPLSALRSFSRASGAGEPAEALRVRTGVALFSRVRPPSGVLFLGLFPGGFRARLRDRPLDLCSRGGSTPRMMLQTPAFLFEA